MTANSSGNGQPLQPTPRDQGQLHDQILELTAANQRLQAELAEVKDERDGYRRELLNLLPESPFDEAEVEDLLAHPEKHQSLADFLCELKSEYCRDGK